MSDINLWRPHRAGERAQSLKSLSFSEPWFPRLSAGMRGAPSSLVFVSLEKVTETSLSARTTCVARLTDSGSAACDLCAPPTPCSSLRTQGYLLNTLRRDQGPRRGCPCLPCPPALGSPGLLTPPSTEAQSRLPFLLPGGARLPELSWQAGRQAADPSHAHGPRGRAPRRDSSTLSKLSNSFPARFL